MAAVTNEYDPLLGRTLAERYRLISALGRGGMSSVYLARHVLIERLSAIKVLREDLARSPEQKERFLREARAVNRINHPNIVEISDYGEVELLVDPARRERRTVVYLVMEYVPGETLTKLMARGPLPETRVVPIALQIASALARAHQTGVTHRDVKPDNVLLLSRRDWIDLVKLTDFGVAKIEHTFRRARTLNDHVLGTPGYVAPEYLLGETAIDGRADLYSLGVLAYEALTGALPWEAQSPAELLALPMTEDPIPLRVRNERVSEALEDVLMRCIRRRPEERPHDAFELIDELKTVCPWAKDLGAVEAAITPSGRSGQMPAVSSQPASDAVSIGAPMPKWGDVPPAQIAEAWRKWHEDLDRRGVAWTPAYQAATERRRFLLESLIRASVQLGAHQQELDGVLSRGRDFRATLGHAIDALARDLSRAHTRVVDLKAQRVQLHLARRNTPDPQHADALLWEEAAVDDELRRANATAQDLSYQVATLQDELFRRNNEHEGEALRATATVEGAVAALLSMHRELESLTREMTRQA